MKYSEEVILKFWSCVSKSEDSDCLVWTKGKLPAGYGQFNFDGNVHVASHRVSWEMLHGDIPDGMIIMHTCDNPSCVRPNHLRLGTMKDNMVDKFEKFRHQQKTGDEHWTHKFPELSVRGSKHGRSKLKEEQVLEIRRLHGTIPNAQIALKFGITPHTVGDIVARRKWAHLKDD